MTYWINLEFEEVSMIAIPSISMKRNAVANLNKQGYVIELSGPPLLILPNLTHDFGRSHHPHNWVMGKEFTLPNLLDRRKIYDYTGKKPPWVHNLMIKIWTFDNINSSNRLEARSSSMTIFCNYFHTFHPPSQAITTPQSSDHTRR